MVEAAPCRLCGANGEGFAVVDQRRYFRCPSCALVFLAAEQLPSSQAEKDHYDTHENDINDPRYRTFLSRLAAPLIPRLRQGAGGLDFGSGPGPALAAMLREAGFTMEIYDPFYADNPDVFHRQYDFITMTEVAEHLHHPGEDFARLDRMLKPGGWLAVMTQILDDETAFAGWHYRRDPTHVAFFQRQTFDFLSQYFGYRIDWLHASVVLMQKAGKNHRSSTPTQV
ncbi:class I SAM-dependent methyltransferase [Alphaproteobacteria bacterium LSUCC0684]